MKIKQKCELCEAQAVIRIHYNEYQRFACNIELHQFRICKLAYKDLGNVTIFIEKLQDNE